MTWTGAPSMVEPLAFRALPSLSPWKHKRVRALATTIVDDSGARWLGRVGFFANSPDSWRKLAIRWAFAWHDWNRKSRPPSTEAGR